MNKKTTQQSTSTDQMIAFQDKTIRHPPDLGHPPLALAFDTAGVRHRLQCWSIQGIFRLIQSIPSFKAEPFKRWLANVCKECHDEIAPPELAEVTTSLKQVPPVRFDLARQVRVFEPYLQYVELSLSGAAIQRHRMVIPLGIQKLGGSKDPYSALKTTLNSDTTRPFAKPKSGRVAVKVFRVTA